MPSRPTPSDGSRSSDGPSSGGSSSGSGSSSDGDPSPGSPSSESPVPPTYVDADRLWVDSRLRALAQRRWETPQLVRLGGRLDGGEVLELGCGRRGTGLRLALDALGAERVTGVELMPASVVAAGRATADAGPRVSVRQGDAADLDLPDGSVDGVLAFHVLHHAQDWRAVVAAGARALRPGGRWYGAEMTAAFVDGRLLRAVASHPARDRPTTDAVVAELGRHGVEVGDRVRRRTRWWVGYVGVRR